MRSGTIDDLREVSPDLLFETISSIEGLAIVVL